MSISPEGQALSLVGALVVGLAFGLLYDLIRPFRLRAPSWGEFFLDLFYWFIVIIVVFLCAPILSNGHVRIFMMAAHFLGAVIYFKLLSRPIRWFTTLVDHLFSRLIALLTWPFRRLKQILAAPLLKIFFYLKKSIKKIFSFLPRWFTIDEIPKKAASAARQVPEHKEGQQRDQNQKGWSSD